MLQNKTWLFGLSMLCLTKSQFFCNLLYNNGIYVCQITRIGISGNTPIYSQWLHTVIFLCCMFFPDDGSVNLMLMVEIRQQFFQTLKSYSRLYVSLSNAWLKFSTTHNSLSFTLGARQLRLALMTTAASAKMSLSSCGTVVTGSDKTDRADLDWRLWVVNCALKRRSQFKIAQPWLRFSY